MGLGAIAGLTGLSKSVDHAAATQREFATMDGLQKDMQKEKEQNLLAQELEAKQYEDIAAKASEMLGPDRQKIRNKSLELQQNIRSKIEEYGSRKAFFENGGVALLSKYKSDLLSSDETLSYMDNKKNSESLVRLQESGKGGLIAQRDLQSLIDYNNGVGDGKITYSGLKAEVKIPHESFNFQEEVPAGNTLAANRLAIYNNWLLENPNKRGLEGQDLEDELILYTIQNHSGMGSNQLKYQNDLAKQNRKEEQEAIQKAGTPEEAPPISLASEMNDGFTSGRDALPMTLDNIMSGDNYTKKMARLNPKLTALGGSLTEYNDYSSNTSSADSNWVTGTQWADNLGKKTSRALGLDTKYKVAGATFVPIQNDKGVIDYLYPGSASANAVNVSLDQSKFYSANGQLLKKPYIDDHKEAQPMKYNGLIYAFVDGNEKMITKPLDSNGKALKTTKGANGQVIYSEEEMDHRKAYSGDLRHEMFAVLTDGDGNKIYQKIGADSLAGESMLTAAIGVPDNLTNKVKSKQIKIKNDAAKQAEINLDRKVLQYEVSMASAEGGVFSTPEFKADVKMSSTADGKNRATLTKAYYMAASYMQNEGAVGNDLMIQNGTYKRSNKNNFSSAVNYSKELIDGLKNTKAINDVDYIKMFAKITAAGNPEDLAHNEKMASTWIKIYELLNKK